MKKQIILAGLAVLAMASCTSNESVLESIDQKISFNVKNYNLQTKGDIDNYDDHYANIPFGTYAWFYEEGEAFDPSISTSQGQPFMVNEEISHSVSKDIWEPSVTYYWPKTGSIDFVSYSPKSMSSYFTVTQNSIEITDYTVSDGSTVDLMYADKAIGQNANETNYFHEGVPTLFHHALAKLNFNMAVTMVDDGKTPATTWEVTIKKVELLNITNNGSVVVTENGSSWTKPTDDVWSPAATPTTLDPVFYYDATGTVLTTNAADFEVVSDYIVIPQTLVENGQKLQITYDIETTTSQRTVIKEEGVTAIIDLLTENKPSWKMNENITYTVKINPSEMLPILFDPAVAPWDDVNATAVVQL